MSKAFTNEDTETNITDADLSYDPVAQELASRGLGAKNYITPAGLERLKKELADLVQDPQGDRRAQVLKKRIEMAHVISPEEQSGDRVLFGATVTVRDEEGEKRIYSIVGVDETDLSTGRISWISPIAKALLQAKRGDVVILKTPQGEEELEIVNVEFKPLEERPQDGRSMN